MPAGKQAVGERLYVFTSNGGHKVRADCVIDAHGEQRLFNNDFSLSAGRNVYFYVQEGSPQIYSNGTVTFANNPDGNFCYTNALEAIATGVATERQRVIGSATARCPDYSLSKIQRTTMGACGGGWSNYWGERNDMSYDCIEKFIGHFGAGMDIVTIRNRRFRTDITLGEVIDQLNANGYNYVNYHCSFCRSPSLNTFAARPGQRVIGAA